MKARRKLKFLLFSETRIQNESVLLCPLPVIHSMNKGYQESKEEVKNVLCLYCTVRMCEVSYKGKNVAVLCPMSLMVQGVGMKTNLSASNITGFCIIHREIYCWYDRCSYVG